MVKVFEPLYSEPSCARQSVCCAALYKPQQAAAVQELSASLTMAHHRHLSYLFLLFFLIDNMPLFECFNCYFLNVFVFPAVPKITEPWLQNPDTELWILCTVTTLVINSCVVAICRYYLFALILNLTRDVYELRLLIECEERYRAAKSPPSTYPSTALPADHLSSPSSPAAQATVALPVMLAWLRGQLHLLVTVLYSNPPLLLDLLKNSCDIFIPLDRLGIYPTGQGFVGACGLASSVLSILTMIHPWLKLKPWTQIHIGGVPLRSHKEDWDQNLTGLTHWSFCEDSSCWCTVMFCNSGRASKSLRYPQNKWQVASWWLSFTLHHILLTLINTSQLIADLHVWSDQSHSFILQAEDKLWPGPTENSLLSSLSTLIKASPHPQPSFYISQCSNISQYSEISATERIIQEECWQAVHLGFQIMQTETKPKYFSNEGSLSITVLTKRVTGYQQHATHMQLYFYSGVCPMTGLY